MTSDLFILYVYFMYKITRSVVILQSKVVPAVVVIHDVQGEGENGEPPQRIIINSRYILIYL